MINFNRLLGGGSAALLSLILPGAAFAAQATPAVAPIKVKPILDARVRFETVDQGALDAEVLTVRLRGGAEVSSGQFVALAEVEATGAAINDYNAFPFTIDDKQRRPQYAVIADPQNVELNRLQLQFKSEALTATVGRQRINLDDQRWVGSVGWRQNEQIFDAVRAEAKLGPVAADLTYAISQRTIFGTDAGPRTAYDGDFVLASAGSKLGRVQGKLFAYLLDYDEDFFLANSSQTYGGIVSAAIPAGDKVKLSIRASYARQSDYGDNPFDYAADYWSIEGGAQFAGFGLSAGWEELGSDNGRAVQTPMATLHKFNGWADLFLTTPATGLQDAYVSVSKTFPKVKALPCLNFNLAYHSFDSATGGIDYGSEWDASAGFKIGKLGLLAKYADYDAKSFGVDTRKFWLQADWAF